MRYIQNDNRVSKPDKENKPQAKAGTKGYDYNKLADAKKIPTKDGYK